MRTWLTQPRRFRGLLLLVAWLLLTALAGAAPEDKTAVDLLLRGGAIYDGSGRDAVVGDVAIRQGQIVAVGTLDEAAPARVIDCRGLIVAPGFIDLHTHCNPVGLPPYVET